MGLLAEPPCPAKQQVLGKNGALHDGRDVPVTTDYRTILAQVCERHLLLPDTKLSEVFPAMPEQLAPVRVIKG
jgi:uncharacterized protein (DUF1501 family)